MTLLKKIYRRLNVRYRAILSAFAKKYMRSPKVLSIEDTLNLIINEHFSVSRNGDGELNLMMGEAIDFQQNDERLVSLLKEALNGKIEKYLSCLPSIFGDNSRFTDKAQRYFEKYLRTKRYYYYHFAKAPVYGDAFISRFYMDYVDKSVSSNQVKHLKRIWEGQDVILVEGMESKLGVNNDLFDGARRLKRILGPAENAFSVYDQLMDCVKKVASKDGLILLALGPTATAMAYDLAKNGYWAVDIGHIDIEYEWYRMGAITKVNVSGKYTNESDEEKVVGTLPEYALQKYESQILTRIQ